MSLPFHVGNGTAFDIETHKIDAELAELYLDKNICFDISNEITCSNKKKRRLPPALSVFTTEKSLL